MIAQMTHEHVNSVSSIHMTSWNVNELSVKLGHDYVNTFYKHIVDSEYSFGFVYLIEDKVVGYATGFYDYKLFNDSLKKKEFFFLIFTLIKRMVIGKIGVFDLINLLQDDNKLKKSKYPKIHLGALALVNEYKGHHSGKRIIFDTISAVLYELTGKGYPGCWGLCDLNNMSMRKLLVKLGFEEVNIVKMIHKSVVLYEKTF